MMTKTSNNTLSPAASASLPDKILSGAKPEVIKSDNVQALPQSVPSETGAKETNKDSLKDKKLPPSELNSTTEPHENDVLCGRGGSINNHIGNEKYRNLVNQKKRVYLTARFKREKRLIAASIVQAVRSTDPPGRFLSRDPRTGVWYDIGDVKARDKTSQALREGAPEIRKEMENDRQQQIVRQKIKTYEGVDDDDEFGDDYNDVSSEIPEINTASSAFSIPAISPAALFDKMKMRSHSMTEMDLEQSAQHNVHYKQVDGRHGSSGQTAQYQCLRPSLKKSTINQPYSQNGAAGLIQSSNSAWSRAATSPMITEQQPQAQPQAQHGNGYRDQLRNGRSVHFESENDVYHGHSRPDSGPEFNYSYRKEAIASGEYEVELAKSWDGGQQMSYGEGNNAFYDYNEMANQSNGTASRHPTLSPYQQQRAKFHKRYQQRHQMNIKTNQHIASPPPQDNTKYYSNETDRPSFEQPFADHLQCPTPQGPQGLHTQQTILLGNNPQPSPVNFRQSSRNEEMPPPKRVDRSQFVSGVTPQPLSSLLQKKHHTWDQAELANQEPMPSGTNPSPSWEAEMARLAHVDPSQMDTQMEDMPKRQNIGHPSMPVPKTGNNALQVQPQVQFKDDVNNKQIVESRIESDDWSARLSCSALMQIPQEWTNNFFNRTNSFEQADASLCGMELCSVGSLGGGSLCNVFIEDDPAKQTAVTETNQRGSNRGLRGTSSWGSGRNSFASGRSLISPFGSDIGSDTSLMSKSSDKLEPLPLDAETPDPSLFSSAGFHNDAPVDHDFVWSWDGKGTE